MSLRADSLESDYQNYRQLPADPDALHKEPTVIEWKYWRLVNNRFPYTKIATAHAMLVLKRNTSIYELTPVELGELWFVILPWADKIYDTTMMNLAAMRSINGTPHIHLVTFLQEYK